MSAGDNNLHLLGDTIMETENNATSTAVTANRLDGDTSDDDIPPPSRLLKNKGKRNKLKKKNRNRKNSKFLKNDKIFLIVARAVIAHKFHLVIPMF